MQVLCPACGAPVQFKSRASVFGVCSYCNMTLVRHDKDIEAIGKMSEMPQDMSPLQIGTSGTFDGSRFEIVGRAKIAWEGGFWNEWYLLFDDGKEGWLADAQGHYMVSFEYKESIQLPEIKSLKIGDSVTVGKNTFQVDDIKQVTCKGSQGEMPVKTVVGRKSTSVDLVGENRQFASIDFSTETNRIFVGRYEDFEKFNFLNLREIDGW